MVIGAARAKAGLLLRRCHTVDGDCVWDAVFISGDGNILQTSDAERDGRSQLKFNVFFL